MNPDTHSLAGAYAVNAVTEEERISFEIHLDQCADCRAEVAELRAAAATLAADVEVPPPPALRASILSAVSQTRQLSPLESANPPEARQATEASQLAEGPAAPQGTAGTAGAGGRGPAEESQPTAPSAPRNSTTTGTAGSPAPVDELAARRNRRLRPWLAAAVAAAVVTIGGLVWQPWEESAPQLTATEQVLRADDAQRLEQPMGGSEIAIVRSPSKRQAVFVADAMPPAPSGRAYQLWFDVPGQGMVSAGLIPTAGQTVAVLLRGDAATAKGAGITLEPESGSEHPTTDPVALFSFT